MSTAYSGTETVTVTGRDCQAWSSQSPHQHDYNTDSMFPLDGSATAAMNYCRDPNGELGRTWCYTVDVSVRWEYCNPPTCEGKFIFFNPFMASRHRYLNSLDRSFYRGRDVWLAFINTDEPLQLEHRWLIYHGGFCMFLSSYIILLIASENECLRNFSYFIMQLYIVCTHQIHLIETILMSTINKPSLYRRSKIFP